MKQKNSIIIILAILGFAFYTNFALAGSATVSWNANTESDLAGYRIYYGTSPRTGTDPKVCTLCGYSTKIDVGKVTTYTLTGLNGTGTYYFSVTAYDTSNNESTFSSEVSKPMSTLTADLNGDNLVNAQDASILVSNWGSTSKPKADINQDGIVNAQDASLLVSQWKTN